MSFQEKFRRTPKFIVWLITAAIGGAIGYIASLAILPALFIFAPSNLYERILWRLFGDWDVIIGFALSFAAIPIVTMFTVILLLPLHHRPTTLELVLAAAIPTMWPAWLTATEVPQSACLQACVAWAIYLALVVATGLFCTWVVRRGIRVPASELPETKPLEVKH